MLRVTAVSLHTRLKRGGTNVWWLVMCDLLLKNGCATTLHQNQYQSHWYARFIGADTQWSPKMSHTQLFLTPVPHRPTSPWWSVMKKIGAKTYEVHWKFEWIVCVVAWLLAFSKFTRLCYLVDNRACANLYKIPTNKLRATLGPMFQKAYDQARKQREDITSGQKRA